MSDITTDFPPRAARDVQRAALRAAIAERGLSRFAVFDTTVEGRIYPNGVDEVSGSVLNDDGRIWFFWTDWDENRQAVTLRHWEEEPMTPLLTSGREYARARRELGLD
jgi:hypothetical protein